MSFGNQQVARKEVDENYAEATACDTLKKVHDVCFFNWYQTEFLKGNTKQDGCKKEWEAYKACLEVCHILAGFWWLFAEKEKRKKWQHGVSRAK